MDNLSKEQRSYAMAQVKAKGNASTEACFIAILREAGITGWRRGSQLPGKPDFVFPKQHVAIFLDGCFWHACPRCFRMPSSNTAYWEKKIGRNKRRDRRVVRELRDRQWHVMRVWEHCLKEPAKVTARVRRLLSLADRVEGSRGRTGAGAQVRPVSAPVAVNRRARGLAKTGSRQG